jgi:dipeptidyl aminopeptidase/acylaminoacyl peptidase
VAISTGKLPYTDIRLFHIDLDTGAKEEISLPFVPSGEDGWVVAPSLQQAVAWQRKSTKSLQYNLLHRSRTTQRQKVSHLPSAQIPVKTRWSPDEGMVAVETVPLGIFGREYLVKGLDVIDIASGSQRTLAKPREGLGWAAWSPDSNEIAFSITAPDVPGRGLLWAESLCQTGSWGWIRRREEFLARWGDRHTRSVVYSARVADGRVRELLRLPKGNTVCGIVWSPTGKQLAVVCWPNTTIRVFDIPKAKPGDWRPAEEILPGP